MSFDWLEYLNLARELSGQTTSPPTAEAKSRSAISRAYYAVLCKARNHLRDNDGQEIPRGTNLHEYVIMEFQESRETERKEIGIGLDRLRINRNRADYNDTVSGLPSLTQTTVMLAERLIARLNRL